MKKLIILFALLLSTGLHSQTYYQYENLKFEKGYVDEIPPYWKFTRQQVEDGKKAVIDKDHAFEGNTCLHLSNPEKSGFKEIATISQSIDAIPYKNKYVRFSAAVKKEIKDIDAKAELFIQVKSKKDTIDYEVRMLDNPINSIFYNYYYVDIYVPVDCIEIRYGFLLNGPGSAYFDDASLNIIQPYYIELQNTKDISDKKIDQLTDFAKAYGLIRFFYPSTENKEADWSRVLINSVELSDKFDYSTPELMNKTLKSFAYLANFSQNEKSYDKKAPYIHPDALPYDQFVWLHKGGFAPRSNGVYSSELFNIFKPFYTREAVVIQNVNISQYKGKTAKISAQVKTNLVNPGSNAQIFLRVDDEKREMVAAEATKELPANNNDWKKYEVKVELPENSDLLKIGLIVIGAGNTWFDDVEMSIWDNKSLIKEIELKNAGFEEQNAEESIARGWFEPEYVGEAGYNCLIDNKSKFKGKNSLLISSDPDYFFKFPKFGDSYSVKISNDLFIDMPIVAQADSNATLPRCSRSFKDMSIRARQFNPVVEDRNSRLAMLIDEFAHLYYFVNFEPNFREKLEIKFKELLKLSANISSDYYNNQFKLMRDMLTLTNDAQARLWNQDFRKEYGIPMLFKQIDNKVLVTKIDTNDFGVSVGDEIIKVNNLNIQDYLKTAENNIPGSNRDWKANIALAELRAGKKGEKINLAVKNSKNIIKNVEFGKNIKLEFLVDDRPPSYNFINQNTVYIDLTNVGDDELFDFLGKFKSQANFVFDLRGLASVSEHFLGFFIKESAPAIEWEIPVYAGNPDDKDSKFRVRTFVEKCGNFQNSKLIFLCDERTIGYSEAILKIAKFLKLGTILGSKTAGASGDALPMRLMGGFSLSFSPIHDNTSKDKHLGITPDEEIWQKTSNVLKNSDALIDRALLMLSK